MYCKLIGEIYVQYNILKIWDWKHFFFFRSTPRNIGSLDIKPSSDENREFHPSWSWLSLSALSARCHTDRPSAILCA